MVLGLRQINTCSKVLLHINFYIDGDILHCHIGVLSFYRYAVHLLTVFINAGSAVAIADFRPMDIEENKNGFFKSNELSLVAFTNA